MASVEENKRIVEGFINDLSAENLEGIKATLADDAQWVIPQLPELSPMGGAHSKESFLKLYEDHHGVFPNKKLFTIKGVTAEGDRVAVEATCYGESIYGPFDNRYHFLFVLRDGKIIRASEYADSLYMSEFAKRAAAAREAK